MLLDFDLRDVVLFFPPESDVLLLTQVSSTTRQASIIILYIRFGNFGSTIIYYSFETMLLNAGFLASANGLGKLNVGGQATEKSNGAQSGSPPFHI